MGRGEVKVKVLDWQSVFISFHAIADFPYMNHRFLGIRAPIKRDKLNGHPRHAVIRVIEVEGDEDVLPVGDIAIEIIAIQGRRTAPEEIHLLRDGSSLFAFASLASLDIDGGIMAN